jgi:hypothetical protein
MRVLSGLLLVGLPLAIHAQREPLRQPTAVPIDLAAALATAGGLPAGNEPQVLVGEIPEWFAQRLRLPDGAVVLGSAFSGAAAVAVVQTLDGGDAAMNGVEAELASRGWRRPPSDMSGGFRFTTPVTRAPSFPILLCGDGKMLSVARGAVRQGRQTWFYRISDVEGAYGACTAGPRGRQMILPVLLHPADATREVPVRNRDCAINSRELGGASGTGDRIRTALSADSLIWHYDRQLAAAGWQLMVPYVTEVKRTWSRMDSTGKSEVIGIDIRTSSDNPPCRDLSLMVYGRDR